MHAFWTSFSDLSIRKKLVVLIYTCVLFMALVLSLVVYNLTSRYARRQIDETNLTAVDQMNVAVHNTLQVTTNMADYFCCSEDTQGMYRSLGKRLVFQSPTRSLRLAITLSNLSAIVFYDLDGNPIDYMTTDFSSNPCNALDPAAPAVGREILNGERYDGWAYLPRDSHGFMQSDFTNKLSYWRLIRSTNDLSPVGMICICLNAREASSPSSELLRSGTMLMLDTATGLPVHDDASLLAPQDCAAVLRSTSGERGTFTMQAGGRACDFYYARLAPTSVYTYLVYPRASIFSNISGLVLYLFIALAAFLALLLPVLMAVSRMVTKPLVALSQSMQKFGSGDYSSKVDFKYKDEIGTLGHVFNTMVVENKRLVDEKYVLTLREREAELSALQSQINPHFLYNLINTLYWRALRNKDTTTADIVYAMGQIFRITLSRGSNVIPLAQELKLVEYYLQLQALQHADMLTYQLDADETACAVPIPKLILQPIVENCIVHGLEDSVKPICVHVLCHVEQKLLYIRVSDDAGGIPPEILALLPDRLPAAAGESGSSRFALKNIAQRLALSYAGAARLVIESTVGRGTDVTLMLPVEGPTHDSASDR